MKLDITITRATEMPRNELRTIRRWGDPALPYSTVLVNTSNFQAVQVYLGVGETGWSGVNSGLYIPHSDMLKVEKLQPNDGFSAYEKMQWLAATQKGKIYLWPNAETNWETDTLIWGIIALGGNVVQVERYETVQNKPMARLVTFTSSDWAKPLGELVATGLVHRCFCAYRKPVENSFGDTPRGIVYNPFFSPKHWTYTEKATGVPDAYWIPVAWLE